MPSRSAPSDASSRSDWPRRLQEIYAPWRRAFWAIQPLGIVSPPTSCVSHNRPALASLGIRDLQRLGQGINNWAAVDTFAIYLVGPVWCRGRFRTAGKIVGPIARPLVAAGRLGCDGAAKQQDARRQRRPRPDAGHLPNAGFGSGRPGRQGNVLGSTGAGKKRAVGRRNVSGGIRGRAVAPRVLREVRNKLKTGLKNPRSR